MFRDALDLMRGDLILTCFSTHSDIAHLPILPAA